ncbi:MAG TPA: hypothetical protein VFH63_03990 [candidate division Zixibacteria bacterium]|nr:hypothetical protein [candidate division Zixibacteria bacterium]
MTALLVLNAHALDLLTMLAGGGLHLESNPVARGVLATSGWLGLVTLKASGAVLLVRLSRGNPRRLALAVLAGLLGALANAVSWSLVA